MNVRPLILPLIFTMAACSSAGDATAPDDDGNEIVSTESAESALAVTETPGKAVWTKLWRWSTSDRPTMASDVAADGTGAQYLARSFAYEGMNGPVIQSMDVTRYSATGDIVFRTSFGASDVQLRSPRIGAGNGRVAVVSTQVPSNLPFENRALVDIFDSVTGAQVHHRVIAGTRTEWTENGESYAMNGYVRPMGVAVDNDGATVIVGEVDGNADLDAGMTTDPNPSNQDGFLLKLSRSGDVLFAKRFEGALVNAVSVDSARAIYVAATGDLATVPNGSAPSIVKFSSAGARLRASTFTTSGYANITHVDVSNGGRVAFGGYYRQDLQLGNVALEDKYQNKFGEQFVAKLDTDGQPMWARGFSGPARRTLAGVGIDSYGQVVATLNFTYSIEIGTQTFSADDNDDVDNLLVKFSAVKGSALWAKQYAGTHAVMNEVTATGLAITSSDRIVMSGVFRKNVDFGKGPITGSLAGNGFLTRFMQ